MRKLFVVLSFLVLSLLLFSCSGQTSIMIQFETNGGNPIEDMEVSINDDDFNLPTPVKEGYTFDGWFLDPEFEEAFSLLSLLKGDVVKLYAKWTEIIVETEIVTVTFVTNGGSPISPQDIAKGSSISEPSEPVKVGHTFDGWYIDSGFLSSFNFSNAINEDITLYAKWTIIVYTVTFLNDDGVVLKTESVAHGSAATAPANPTKPETASHTYVFLGWDKPFNVITSNLTVNAQYTGTIKTFTVNFYDEDGTTLLKSETVPYGSDATPPTEPTKANTDQFIYTFLGWDLSYIVVTNHLTIKAMYTETVRSYTVNFYDADRTTLIKTESVLYGSDATAPANPTKDSTVQYNYTFLNWDKSFTNITGPLDVYATYTETVRSYTVNFYDVDGTTLLKTQTVLYGENATAPIYTVPAATDRVKIIFVSFDKNIQSVMEDIDTKPIVNTYFRIVYHVSFDPETQINQNYVTYSDWILQGSPTPSLLIPLVIDGYIFRGWKLITDEPYVEHPIINTPIEVYGLYFMEIDETRLYINQAHESETNTTGLVEGTIYIILPGMGFFMFDETGHIFVMSQETISLGDKVSFEAKVSMMESPEMHILTIHSGFAILSSTNPLPTPIKMSVSEILSLDDSSWVNFGLLVETYGILDENEQGYYLRDIFGDSTLPINSFGELSPNPFEPLVGQRVRLSGFTVVNSEIGMVFVIYIEDYIPIEVVIPTNQDLMNELVAAASKFLNGLTFYSGEILPEDFITPPENFNATVLWETFGPNASLFSFDTLVFAEVDEIQTIDIRITITIGDITEIITVQWYLKPITITSVIDVLNGPNETYYIVEVVILYFGGPEEPMIVADETGILLVFAKVEAAVGDLVVIKGLRYETNGMIAFFGTPNIVLYEIKANSQPNPILPTVYTLAQIQALPSGSILYPTFIQTSGNVFNQEEFKMGVELTSGENYLPIMGINPPIIAALKSLHGQTVTLQGVLFAQTDKMGNKMYYMVYFNYPGSFDAGELTNEQKIQLMTDFIASLNLGELREGDILLLPEIHPMFGIEINWTPNMATALLIDSETLEIKPLSGEAILNFQVSFLVGGVLTTLDIEYVAYPSSYVVPPFVPGYKGDAPTLPVEEIVGADFVGLFIYKDGYRRDFMSVLQREVHLTFPMPDEVGATHYTIQYYHYASETWITVMDYDTTPVLIYYNNVTLRNPNLTMYRLYAHGIDKVSNYVIIDSNVIHTEFLGWSLDESVYLSEHFIMAPFVGRALEVSATVYDYDTSEYVDGFVNYQWYKVHPVSFQMILIPDATNPIYKTTYADIGYYMMVKVSGDGINVGGFIQIFSYWEVVLPIEGYITNITNQGFTLNLSHLIDINDLQNIELRDNMTWDVIPIISVTQGENAAIYHIEANLTGIMDGYLTIETLTWVLIDGQGQMGHMMQGIFIMFSSGPVGPPPPDGPPMPS